MDFSFSQEQNILREAVRSFVQKEIQPLVKDSDDKGVWPDIFTKKLAEMGLLGIVIPP